MSVKIMAQVWENGPEDKAQLLVLLALADFADDKGVCWPSMLTIGQKARMSDRNARRVLRDLEDAGYVTSRTGGGRAGCSEYTIVLGQNVRTPDKMSENKNTDKMSVPRTKRAETRTKRAQNPDTAMSAEPSGTIIEPSEKIKAQAPRKSSDEPEIRKTLEAWASPAAVTSFLAYRRKSKAKALTLTGAKRLAVSLRTIFDAGGNGDDALGLAEERGWQTIQPDWYWNAKGKSNGNGNSGNARPGPHHALMAGFAAAANSEPRRS